MSLSGSQNAARAQMSWYPHRGMKKQRMNASGYRACAARSRMASSSLQSPRRQRTSLPRGSAEEVSARSRDLLFSCCQNQQLTLILPGFCGLKIAWILPVSWGPVPYASCVTIGPSPTRPSRTRYRGPRPQVRDVGWERTDRKRDDHFPTYETRASCHLLAKPGELKTLGLCKNQKH